MKREQYATHEYISLVTTNGGDSTSRIVGKLIEMTADVLWSKAIGRLTADFNHLSLKPYTEDDTRNEPRGGI